MILLIHGSNKPGGKGNLFRQRRRRTAGCGQRTAGE